MQRFVDASIVGWYNYLYHDNKAANALIKRQNPEMTDALLAYSIAKMKEYGIVDSGDAATLGIGAMTDARMKNFYDKMVRAGVVKPSVDLAKVLHAAVRQQEGGIGSAAEVTPRAGLYPPPAQRWGGSRAKASGVGGVACDFRSPPPPTPPHRCAGGGEEQECWEVRSCARC